jgi:excisionase family DNA binding protein
MGGRLLTTRQVSELLGLSPASALRRWQAGELPGFRLSSNVVRFSEDEIDAWLAARHRGSNGAADPRDEPGRRA